jgi:hypothetical protein
MISRPKYIIAARNAVTGDYKQVGLPHSNFGRPMKDLEERAEKGRLSGKTVGILRVEAMFEAATVRSHVLRMTSLHEYPEDEK